MIAAALLIFVVLAVRAEQRFIERRRFRMYDAHERRYEALAQAEATRDVDEALAAVESPRVPRGSEEVGATPPLRRARMRRTYAGNQPVGLYLMGVVGLVWFTFVFGFPGNIMATGVFFVVAGAFVAASRHKDVERLKKRRPASRDPDVD